MSCPSELTLTRHADGELTAADMAGTDPSAASDIADLQAHLATCAACAARIDALRVERRAIAAALAHEAEPVQVPELRRPASRLGVTLGGGALLLVAALIAAAPGLIDFSVPVPLTWFDPTDAVGFVDLSVRLGIFLLENGGAIMTSLSETAAAAAVIGFAAWLVVRWRRSRSGPLLLMLATCAAIAWPTSSEAIEVRHQQEGHVLIPADQPIDDTLIAVGETVEVDGDVSGDLIAVGRRVVVRGRVGGQLITAAQTVSVEGEVAGTMVGFAQTLDVRTPRIGRNLFGFGATVETGRNTTIESNAVVFGERVELAGPVGRDVLGFAESLEVGNTVGGALTAYANRLTLLAAARIAGDVTAHVPEADHVNVAPNAVIGGELNTEIVAREEHDQAYTSFGYYVGQVLRFAAAFVTGLVLLALVPGLRRLRLDNAAAALVASGVGLVTLVAVPIIAVIVAVTIIGIPLALLGLVIWLVAIYLAKIVLAHLVGARILAAADNPRHFAVALTVGLLLMIIVVELPFIGGVLNFVLTICGLGLLVLFGWRAFRREPPTVPV